MRLRLPALLALALLASGCRLADPFVTSAVLGPMAMPLTPHVIGLPATNVDIPGPSGERLQGWLIPCESPKGSVFLCHGNMGGSFFLWAVAEALHKEGYQAFLFDYAGFGCSGGSPSALGLADQARAAYAAFRAQPALRTDRIAVYGVSLGAPVAYRVMAEHPEVKAGVFESLFDPPEGLKKLGHPWLGRHARLLLGEQADLGPLSEGVGDRPALFIVPHGDFLPFPLQKAWLAHPARKSLWSLDAMHYPTTFYRFPEAYRAKLGEFLGESLEDRPSRLKVVSWKFLRKDGSTSLVTVPQGFESVSGRVKGLLPSRMRFVELPDSPDSGLEIMGFRAPGQSQTLSGDLCEVEVVLASETRLPVEAVALDPLLPGLVEGSVRGWCGPGETTLRIPCMGLKPSAVAAFVDPQAAPAPSEVVRTMDLAGPSSDPAAEDAMLRRWLLDVDPSTMKWTANLGLTRLAFLRGIRPGTYEEAFLELARRDPPLRRPVLGYLGRLYPDFRSLVCEDPLEAFPGWLERHRAFLGRSPDGRYRLASRPVGRSLLVFGSRDCWKEASLLLDGKPVEGLRKAHGRLEARVELEGSPRSLELAQGRLKLIQPLPEADEISLDLDRLAEREGPYVGVTWNAEKEGVRITQVLPGTPAEKAGLKAGDLIISMDGASSKEFRNRIYRCAVGDRMKLEVSRKGTEGTLALEVTLGKRPPPAGP